ncbi:hypothetical protein HY249_02710 [Candidatus Azambacteria bacterium]|nr:hypothetical protein [Candidatus Azambacteria bacterium]
MNEEKNIFDKSVERRVEHYYGDEMRRFFFFAAFILVFTYPFLSGVTSVYHIMFVIFCALLLVFLAGITSPLHRWVMIVNTFISFFGVIFFEYNGINFYLLEVKTFSGVLLFALSHILAITFFFAFYYGLKTLRGMRLI